VRREVDGWHELKELICSRAKTPYGLKMQDLS
jgi:hypothetical protein